MLPHMPFLPRIPSSPALPHILQLHAFPPCHCPPYLNSPPTTLPRIPYPLKSFTHRTPTSHRQMLPQAPTLSSHIPTPDFPTTHLLAHSPHIIPPTHLTSPRPPT